jgi:hypothetical protein
VLKILTALNSLLGTIVALLVLALLGVGGWIGLKTYLADKWALQQAQAQLTDREAEVTRLSQDLTARQKEIGELSGQVQRQATQIVALNKDLEAKQQEIERLQAVVKLLKLNQRVAQIHVLGQERSEDGKELRTTFSFVEVNEEGRPIEQAKTFTIKGDVVYVDAWVVKFDYAHLEQSDPLRSTSICLFRRVFGEDQRPADGFVLDAVGSQPAAYRTGGKPSEFEQQIWSRFWEYANNPTLAKQAGVRAAHGEAPSIKLLPGRSYRVLLQVAGGLSIDPPENEGKDERLRTKEGRSTKDE